jgi:uncharacterized protein with GYD domain
MIFISLGKLRNKPTKDMSAESSKIIKEFQEQGNRILGFYWTLGRYDTVLIFEAPNEKVAMELCVKVSGIVAT